MNRSGRRWAFFAAGILAGALLYSFVDARRAATEVSTPEEIARFRVETRVDRPQPNGSTSDGSGEAETAQPPSNRPSSRQPQEQEQTQRPSRNKWRLANAQERQAVAATIRGQLDAFKRDDWNTAIGYQSAELKSSFPSASQLQNMIEEAYPQFADYREVNLEAVRVGGDGVMAEVMLTGMDNVRVRALYQLKRENGALKIAGVQGGTPAPRPTERVDVV